MKNQTNIQSFSGKAKDLKGLVIPQSLLDVEINKDLIHQVVVAHLASTHHGTRAQKTRSEVRGGGAKPWKQKGTGRARAGTIRGPIWRGGGVTFAAKSQDNTKKVNKKMYKKAMMHILSHLLESERLLVVDAIDLAEPKTKLLKSRLESFSLKDVCLVVNKANINVELAARNIPQVSLVTINKVNPVLLLKHKNILMEQDAFNSLMGGNA